MTSRKLITCLLASMVIRSPLLLKMRHISFLMFSVSLGVALVMASPSSRTMGSYDGAETCELVGNFLLSQLQHLNINVGLYRDECLTKFKLYQTRDQKALNTVAKRGKFGHQAVVDGVWSQNTSHSSGRPLDRKLDQ